MVGMGLGITLMIESDLGRLPEGGGGAARQRGGRRPGAADGVS